MPTQTKDHEEKTPDQIPWYDSLRAMLAPYQPVATHQEADKEFTTAEIKAALELHYAVPQGDPEHSMINGLELVDVLHELGFTAANMGGLGLHWLMKKK